jgi:hypothetical protein
MELFEDLEGLHGEHAMRFTDPQKLSYLLTAIRREPSLEAAYVYLQSQMNRGVLTFALAMSDLELRCETHRADGALALGAPVVHGQRRTMVADILEPDFPHNVSDTQLRAFVTTANKRLNRQSSSSSGGTLPTNASHGTPCLILGCDEMCGPPLCRLHFASMVCGKSTSLTLKHKYGEVKFDKTTQKAIYPAAVPESVFKRPPRNKPSRSST